MKENVEESLSYIFPERKKQKLQTDELLRALTKAIRDAYPEDPTTPGIVISILNNNKFYCSVIRFKSKFGQNKYVLVSHQNNTLFQALEGLAQKFASHWDKENIIEKSVPAYKSFPKEVPTSYDEFDFEY